MVDYNKVRSEHFIKRLNILAGVFANRNPIIDLNTASIDNNESRINICKIKLDLLNIEYEYRTIDYLKAKDKLDIAYLLPHNSATGGLKILLEQANYLSKRGHNVFLYCHLPKPNWINVDCTYRQVPEEVELYKAVPYADIVIAGYWDLITDTVSIAAPLKYYIAQGDIDIFEWENIEPIIRNTAFAAHNLPVKILTVSKIMQRKIKEIYGRESLIIPNAIDNKVFFPSGSRHMPPLKILIIGSDQLFFKGHEEIIAALYELRQEGYMFRIHWITPVIPSKTYYDGILNIEYSINPTQEEIGRIYRESDIYISGSHYEAFSLPPLEAMASKCCVITAENDGVKEYAFDGKNCLMYKAGDIWDLKVKLKMAINSPELRRRLCANGLKTSKNYSWDKSINILEKEFIDTKNNFVTAYIK